MKKLLSLLTLVGILGVAGCSCSKEGVYKFDSITITEGDESHTYTCTTEEIAEHEELEMMCGFMTSMQFELKDDKAITSMLDEEGNVVEGSSDESEYKIEDGKFFIKDGEEFEEAGTYSDGKIILSYGDGVSVAFKKK